MSNIAHPHVSSSPGVCGGSPCLSGTRIPVRLVVGYVLHQGMTPEEVLATFPHLSLAAIYDALAYYYDNRAEVDAEIKADADLDTSHPLTS